MTLEGGCLCGGVTYQIVGELPANDGDMPLPVFCHCTDCQHLTGGAFFASCMAPLAQFTLTSGDDCLERYESQPGVLRSFCRRCGSSMFYENREEPEQLYVALGTIDGFATKPRAHIFVRSKAQWYDINDDLPRFEAYP
jgi:hypothetical protein